MNNTIMTFIIWIFLIAICSIYTVVLSTAESSCWVIQGRTWNCTLLLLRLLSFLVLGWIHWNIKSRKYICCGWLFIWCLWYLNETISDGIMLERISASPFLDACWLPFFWLRLEKRELHIMVRISSELSFCCGC